MNERKIINQIQIPYLLTWSTYNSRTSKRMIKFKGEMGESFTLSEESKEVIAKALITKVKQKNYKVYAVNILDDHVHFIVVSSYSEIINLVRHLKGMSAYMHNQTLNMPTSTRVWGKSFSKRLLTDKQYLTRAISYVENNHEKHNASPLFSSKYNEYLKNVCIKPPIFRS